MGEKNLSESFMHCFPYLNALEERSTEEAKPPGRNSGSGARFVGGVQENDNQLNDYNPKKRCKCFMETNPSPQLSNYENKDRGRYSLVTGGAF